MIGPITTASVLIDIVSQGTVIQQNGTVLIDSSGQILTVDGYPVNSSEPYCPTCGQPVNLATGSMWHRVRDFALRGRTAAAELVFERTYLAHSLLAGGDLGPHWVHNWETRVIAVSPTANSNLVWIDEHGGAFTFVRQPDGSFKNPAGFFGSLTESSDRFTLDKTHGVRLTFSKTLSGVPAGRLAHLSEPHGEKVTLAYDSGGQLSSISTGLAGTVTLSRDSSRRVIAITRARDHLSYSYGYDSNGRLSSFTDFARRVTSYGYRGNPAHRAADGLLSSITDPIQRQTTFTYTPGGKAQTQTEPGRATRTFSYSTTPTESLTQVQDIDGGVSTYHFNSNLLLTETDSPDGSKTLSQWSAQNQLVSSTDEMGFTTLYGHDARGNLTSIQRHEDAQPTQISYDETFDAPTLVTPLAGAPTQLKVDPATGDITQVSRADSSQTLSLILGHDILGNVLSRDNGLATYADQTDSNGLRTMVFDARNPETRTYDHRGRVIARSFRSGRVLGYAYDDFDQVTRVDDTSGPSVLSQFDAVHRLISRSVQSQDGNIVETTQYTWDDRDRLTLVIDALGQRTRRYYDQVNPDGSIRVIDQPTRIVDANGHETDFVFDSRLRLIQKTDANQGITRYGYNARGDLTSVVDPSNNLTTFDFDGNRRLVKRTRASLAKGASGKMTPALEVSLYAYDPSGKLLSRQDVSVRDAQGGRKIAWTYDAFDRLVEKVESKTLNGKTVIQDDSKYTYQPQLDVQRIASADNENALLSFQSEAVPPFAFTGYAVRATDPKNPLDLIQDSYTITPAVTAAMDAVQSGLEGTLLSETHDPSGRLSQLVGSLGQGQEQSKLTSTITYDNLFRRRGIVDVSSGRGGSRALMGSFSYDLLNRFTSVYWDGDRDELFSGHFSEALTYDAVGNITESDRELGKLNYGFDALNELTRTSFQARHRWDGFENASPVLNRSWQLDLTGNRVQDSLRGAGEFIANGIVSDRIDDFASDADGFGNVVDIVSRRSGLSRHLTYRADGKLASFETRRGDGDERGDRERSGRESNERDREEGGWGIPGASKAKARYFFDALGRRIAKQLGHVDERDHSQCDVRRGIHHHEHFFTQSYSYLVDQDKILLSKDSRGEVSLYLDGPGMDDHLGEIGRHRARGYVKDHLGSIMNSPATGGVPLYGAFGERLGQRRALNAFGMPAVVYGFTGRQLDPESGLYYYRARMYDPSIGRFTSRDPLGQRGDANLYRYAKNSPIVLADPSGNCPLLVPLTAVIILFNFPNDAPRVEEPQYLNPVPPGWYPPQVVPPTHPNFERPVIESTTGRLASADGGGDSGGDFGSPSSSSDDFGYPSGYGDSSADYSGSTPQYYDSPSDYLGGPSDYFASLATDSTRWATA